MKKLLKDKTTYLFLLITVLFFGIFVRLNFSVDTYLLFASRNMSYIREFIQSARFLTAGMFLLFQLLKFDFTTMYIVSFIFAIIFTTISLTELKNLINKYIKNNLISIILSTIIIINPYVIELWLFIETSIMMLSILSCILALKYFDKYLTEKKNKNLLHTGLFMLLGIFSYQGTVALFISIATILIIINSKNIKEFIKNNVIAVLCYGVPAIINCLIINLIGNNRVTGSHDLIKTIDFIIKSTKDQLLNGFGLYPRGILAVLLLLTLISALVLICKQKATSRTISMIKLIYIIFITYIFTIAPIFTQSSSSLIIFPRTSYAFGAIIGIIFFFCTSNLKLNILKETFYNIVKILSVILLIVEFVTFTNIAINRYIVNYMDKYIVLEIEEKIANYERETGQKIEKLSVYNKEGSKKFYTGLEDRINVSAKNEQPSGTALLVFYTNRPLEVVEENIDIYNEYFKGKNWDLFGLDQIVLDGNTLHWYLY